MARRQRHELTAQVHPGTTLTSRSENKPGHTERGAHQPRDTSQIPPHYRVRHDKIDAAGAITIRYNSRLHHIGLSTHLRGTRVLILIDELDIRVLDHSTGTLIRKLTLDPTRDYQPRGVKCGNSPENRITV
jgi:hypothetical protein